VFFKRKRAQAVARHGHVTGKVQSVAFRFYTRQEATQLQLTGWVQNLPDGRVEFHVQGGSENVQEFLQWIQVGPPLARVSDLAVESVAIEDLEHFEIR
jgi:acylphosphatase